LTQSLPPVISIYSPGDGDRFTGSEAKIIYAVRSPSGAAVDRIDVLVDGRPVGTPRGVERADAASAEAVSLPEAATVGSSTAGKVVVLLPNRDVTVSLIARTGDLVSAPASIRLSWGGPGADLLKPKLYGLVVGVSRYADAALALKYAAKDATDFAAALRGQGNGGGGLYAAIEVKVLTDGDATRDNIMDGLDWLRRTVTGRDIGIVYLAGHGMTDEAQEFWFLPVAATPENLASRGVAKEDIQRTLDRLAGKAILFLDACHSASVTAGARPRGTVEINPVINDFASAEHGVITFSSSLGREVSLERADWGSRGNGAFTAALVEGLGDGKADLLGSGRITLSELDAYVVNRVGQLTNGLQHPVMTRPNTVSDFPIGIADR
jgi:hypothetical protein